MSTSYTCIHCGIRMTSKCRKSRSHFVSHGSPIAKFLASNLTMKLVPYREGSDLKCLQLEVGVYDHDADVNTVAREFSEDLSEISRDELKQIFCKHSWEHTGAGPCINGTDCCG